MRNDAITRPADTGDGTDTAFFVGGKARRLIELQQAGFRVPEFVCAPCDVDAVLAQLGAPLAVRSSASAEDGHDVSFAGQFQSFLDLRTAEAVKRAIVDCERSLHAPSVAAYCEEIGVPSDRLRMGVIVQRMIEPELSGVAFTVNPMTGSDEVVIEACEGVGEALLQGHTAPLPSDHPLLARHTPEIERIARAVQRQFGAPQDIEFAVQDDVLYLLQARPITRIRFGPSVGEWTNADFRDGGVSCTVCTPLMWSLYETIWARALPGFLRDVKLLPKGQDFEAGRLFFGRPYWNLGAVKTCLATLPGFVERKFDEDLQVHATYEGDGAVTPVTLRGVLRAIPTLLATKRIWKRQARFDAAFLDGGFDALAAKYETVPPSDPTSSFGALIEDVFRITEANYFRTIFCASLAKLAFSESFPEATDTALVAGLPPLRHLEPVRIMREMAARGERDIPTLMARFRHRSRNELDLRTPRWDEDPEWVEAVFENLPAESGGDPHAIHEAALARALAELPRGKRRAFIKKLTRLRHFLWLREEMRDLSTRTYYLLRRHVLAIAAERALGDDVFFMTWQELLVDDRSGVDHGRAVFEGFRNFDAPNEIGARFVPVARDATPHDVMRGIAASPGSATGPAFVARDVRQAMHAPAGSILVCPFTDPGWTPVLTRVAAAVTENGGQLSHAAVICREFGIPAVLGVSGVTRTIRSGDVVIVDGDAGTVAVSAARPNGSRKSA